MNSHPEVKLSGLNNWFIIEIMSFYGFIIGAALFILESQVRSSFGLLKKENMRDRYKYDLITYHRQEIYWYGFVVILLFVNVCTILINWYHQHHMIKNKVYTGLQDPNNTELRPLLFVCLGNHVLQLIFTRQFFDEKI